MDEKAINASLGAMLNAGQVVAGNNSHIGNINHYSGAQPPSLDTCRAQLLAVFGDDPKDYRASLETRKGPRTKGTCDWIFNQEKYSKWRSQPSQLLWISGDAGKGKTMLALYLIQSLEQARSDTNKRQRVIYFFCTSHDQKNTGAAILRGLLLQLLQDETNYQYIAEKYMQYGARLFEDAYFEALWSVFESIVRQPSTSSTVCILDGLDECLQDELSDFWVKICALFDPIKQKASQQVLSLSMIIISRNFPDSIELALQDFPRLRLDTDLRFQLEWDVKRFIDDRMDELQCSKRRHPELVELREVVKQKLSKKAGGTYLWAGFAIKALRKERCSTLEDAIDRFPPGLHNVYKRMLENIEEEYQDIVLSILRWVVFSTRPLTLIELGAATSMRPGRGQSLESAVEDYLSYAGDLIAIHEETILGGWPTNEKRRLVSPVHSSVTEYLIATNQRGVPVKFHLDAQKSHGLLASRTLDYTLEVLTVTDSSERSDSEMYRSQHPLLMYALQSGLKHFLESRSPEEKSSFDHPLFDRNQPAHSRWVADQLYAVANMTCPSGITFAHLAAFLGGIKLLQMVFDPDCSEGLPRYPVDVRDGSGRTPLFYAVFNNQGFSVFYLLLLGADVNATDDLGQTPLHIACGRGHAGLTEGLLHLPKMDRAKNSSSLDQTATSMLDSVPCNDYEETAPGSNSSGTPLHLAAASNHAKPLLFLLVSPIHLRVDINARDDKQRTALHRVALLDINSPLCCRILVYDRGIDLRAYDQNGETALHVAAASARLFTETLKVLLKTGLEVDVPTCEPLPGRTALMVAAREGNQEAVDLLIEHGANVAQHDALGRNSLHWLCIDRPGCLNVDEVDQKSYIAHVLFERMSVDDFFAKDSHGNTAYDLALKTFEENIIRHMGVLARFKDYETVLPIARHFSQVVTPDALLDLLKSWEAFIMIPPLQVLYPELPDFEAYALRAMDDGESSYTSLLEKRKSRNEKLYPTSSESPDEKQVDSAIETFDTVALKWKVYDGIQHGPAMGLRCQMYEADYTGSWDEFIQEMVRKGVVASRSQKSSVEAPTEKDNEAKS